MSNGEPGYLYRFIVANAQDVTDLIERYVLRGPQVFAFGGTTKELLPIAAYNQARDIPLGHDFGHAFSLAAEIRWKLTDDGTYDVLLLQEQPVPNKVTIAPLMDVYTASDVAEIVLTTPREVAQRRYRWRLGYKEYLGANKAVQFVRYTRRREEPLP